MKKITLFLLTFSILLAHPVSYTIDLQVQYDATTQTAKILCQSNSRNKCGLHDFHLLDEKEIILLSAKFPFMKDYTKVKVSKKPSKMIFYLRQIPEHTYMVIIP